MYFTLIVHSCPVWSGIVQSMCKSINRWHNCLLIYWCTTCL